MKYFRGQISVVQFRPVRRAICPTPAGYPCPGQGCGELPESVPEICGHATLVVLLLKHMRLWHRGGLLEKEIAARIVEGGRKCRDVEVEIICKLSVLGTQVLNSLGYGAWAWKVQLSSSVVPSLSSGNSKAFLSLIIPPYYWLHPRATTLSSSILVLCSLPKPRCWQFGESFHRKKTHQRCGPSFSTNTTNNNEAVVVHRRHLGLTGHCRGSVEQRRRV